MNKNLNDLSKRGKPKSFLSYPEESPAKSTTKLRIITNAPPLPYPDGPNMSRRVCEVMISQYRGSLHTFFKKWSKQTKMDKITTLNQI